MFLTLTMKEGGNVKFGGKQSDKIIGTGTFYIQVTKDTPEPDQISDSEVSPEVEPTSEAQDELAFDEAQDGS